MDCSPPGSSIHGTLQARTLEWVSFPSSRGSSWPRDRIQISCIAGRLFSVWAPGKPYVNISKSISDYTHSYIHCAVDAEPQSGVWLSETAGTAARHAPLSSGISQSLLKFMSIELVILSNHLILCRPLLLPSVFPSIRVFSNESALPIRGPKYWSFSTSILPMNIQDWFPLGLMDWISLQSKGLKDLLQHDSLKASILQRSAFFMVQLSHPYMTTGKTIALTMQTFVGKVLSLLFNTLSRFLITFLLRSKHLLISLTSTLHLLKLISKLLNSTFNVVTSCYKVYVNVCVYLYSCVCTEICLCVPLNIWKVVNPGELDTKRVR